ncbi:MAG: hypothetical protein ABL907_23985 [Hyphomicrobium sp.]
MSDEQIIGYTVAYEQGELPFLVYVLLFIAIALFAAGWVHSIALLMPLSLVPAAGVYYSLPLLETGKPRLGAGQYGLFLEGLGLVQWRAIDGLDLVTTYVRGTPFQELHVPLKSALGEALLLDWRRRPLARQFMRLPWSLCAPKVIRIPLDILDKPPAEIHAKLQAMWRYYRGQ